MTTPIPNAFPLIDGILSVHRAALGRDFEGYRNHTYRVATLCRSRGPACADDSAKIEVAAAFHDLGIWTSGTFDYLAPSVALAGGYLSGIGKADWSAEVTGMILNHHKVRAVVGEPSPLAESFRRADWADVTGGLVAFGLSRALLAEVYASWPSAGFHRRLLQLGLARVRSHPFNPLPMVRL